MEDALPGILTAAALIGFALIWLLSYARKGKHSESEHSFEQAGIRVSYDTGKFRIKNKIFSVTQVSKLRTSSGSGKYGNQSSVWIDIDDMDYPTHQIDFVRENDAQKFAMRFAKAVEKAGGPKLS